MALYFNSLLLEVYMTSYQSSTYDSDGYEREVHCPAGRHVIYISEARRGFCPDCQAEAEQADDDMMD